MQLELALLSASTAIIAFATFYSMVRITDPFEMAVLFTFWIILCLAVIIGVWLYEKVLWMLDRLKHELIS